MRFPVIIRNQKDQPKENFLYRQLANQQRVF